MRAFVVSGTDFRHQIYLREGKRSGQGSEGRREIHIYLEGDGRPWLTRQQVAPDPTGGEPLALRLMAQDSADALYVGRPCYHGLVEDPGCTPWLWTHGRYSPEVVTSMTAAIDRYLPEHPRPRITLIGYSGGGVLALLIAAKLTGVTRVMTIAANLDTDAWTSLHGYSPLTGSLNPASQAPLATGIEEVHLVGARDQRVPPSSIAAYRARNPQATIRILEEFDHRCCWVEHWPEILGENLPRTHGSVY